MKTMSYEQIPVVVACRVGFTAALGAAGLGMLAPVPARAENSPRFSVVDLGNLRSDPQDPQNQNSRAFAINQNGDVTGEAEADSRAFHAFVWRNGVRVDLGTLGGLGSRSAGFGINGGGSVAGVTQDANSADRAFRFLNGPMINLGSLGGPNSRAFAINAAGRIAGSADNSSGRPQAVLFEPDGSIRPLGSLGGATSTAFGINDGGLAVGEAKLAGGVTVPFVFNGTAMVQAPTPGRAEGRLFAIGSSNFAAGEHILANGKPRAYRLGSGSALDLGTLGGDSSRAFGVNGAGNVVGTARTLSGASNAFLWEPAAGMQNLNNLIGFNAGWVLEEARAINDPGLIVGFGINPQGHTRGFLLTPQVLRSFTFTPNPVAGGNTVRATIRLSAQASVDLPVDLRVTPGTPNDGTIQFPAAAVIPRGRSSVDVTINTRPVDSARTFSLQALCGGVELASSLTVRPPQVSSISASPNPVVGTRSTTCTARLDGPVASIPISVTVTSSNPALAPVNTSGSRTLTFGPGQSAQQFDIRTGEVSSRTDVTLTASGTGVTRTTRLTVRPPRIERLGLGVTAIAGGARNVAVNVTLEEPAPAGGVRVVFGTEVAFASIVDRSDNEILSFVVPQRSRSCQVFVATKPVLQDRTIHVSASAGGDLRRVPLLITRARLAALRLDKSEMWSFESAQATVRLDGPAPEDMTVSLSSSDTSAAKVAGTVVIRQGRDSATVEVKGQGLVSKRVTITARLGSDTRSQSLLVKAFGTAE